MAKYSVHQQPAETLLSWIKSGDIAIPEIQRPFVGNGAKVRDLIDCRFIYYKSLLSDKKEAKLMAS
jgi:hypothetical protein